MQMTLSSQKIPTTILLFVLSLCFYACSALELPKPDVSIVNMNFTEVSLLETSMEFTLRISNPSPDPLVLEGALYHIYLNGTDIGTGMSDDMLEVPRLSSAEQRVKVSLSNFSMITRIKSLVEQQKFDYRIDADFYVRKSGIRRRASTSREGRFDFNSKF